MNRNPSRRRGLGRMSTLAGLLALGLAARPALAIDTQPFDYGTLAPGTNVFIGYYLDDDYDRYVDARGDETRAGTALHTSLGVLRFAHWTRLAGMTTVVNVLLPFGEYTRGSLQGAPLGGTHDMQLGNLRFNTTVFFVDDATANRHLGLGVYVDAPTGSYRRDRDLNLGDDRWSGTLQLGYLQGIGAHLNVELVADATWHQDNGNATRDGRTLSQDPSYSAQGWVTYAWKPGQFLSVGYSAAFGGKSYLDDVATGNRTDSRTWRVAGGVPLGGTTFLAAELDYPTRVRGGFQRDLGVLLRLVKVL